MHDEHATEVWYDGGCPLCRASRAWCEGRDRDGRLVFRDIRSVDDGKLPVDRAAAEASMWIVDPEGRLARGFSGWRAIMAQLPGWRWIARLTGVPPLRWLGPPVYRLVARLRHLLG